MKNNQMARKSALKSLMKTGTAVTLALVLILTQTAVVTFADNNGKGNNHSNTEMNQNQDSRDNHNDNNYNNNYNNFNNYNHDNDYFRIDDATKEELRERLQMMIGFGDGNWLGLTQGMYKRGFLPYGLAKRYSKGDFPYGLAKHWRDYNCGEDQQQINLEQLKTLITSSETLINLPGKTYLDGATVKFQVAIDAAKKFTNEYTTSQSNLVKGAYDKLKTAMFDFSNSELLDQTKVAELNALLANLTVYKTNYYAKLTEAKKVALDSLIVQIGLYVPAVSTRPLTMGIYNDILVKAKAFEDHIDRLKALVAEADALLYLDPNAAVKVFKNKEGVLVGNYLEGSNIALENAILLAKNSIKNANTQTVVTIEASYVALNAAIHTYKNNVVLADQDIATLLLVQAELQAYYDNNVKTETPLTTLKTLIDQMKLVTNKTVPLTQTKLNTLLDASKVYIQDLYDQIKAEITIQINLANVMLTDVTKTYGAAERIVLTSTVASAQLYLSSTTQKYDVFKSHMTALTNAMTLFQATGVPVVVTP